MKLNTPSPTPPGTQATLPECPFRVEPIGPSPALLPSDWVAELFGYRPGKHFRREAAPKRHGLAPVQVGARFYFHRVDVARALFVLNTPVAVRAARVLVEECPADRTPVTLVDVSGIARIFGYSSRYFLKTVAPRLGLDALQVGPRHYFDAAAVEAVAARTPSTLVAATRRTSTAKES